MAAGTDAALQALLDPEANGRGIMIARTVEAAGALKRSYYFTGNVTGVAQAFWLDLLISDDDATHNTAVRAAFGVA